MTMICRNRYTACSLFDRSDCDGAAKVRPAGPTNIATAVAMPVTRFRRAMNNCRGFIVFAWPFTLLNCWFDLRTSLHPGVTARWQSRQKMVTYQWQFRELRVSLRSPRTRKRYGRTLSDKSPTRTREAQATEESLYDLPRARAAAEKGLFPLIPVPKPVPETPS